MNTWNYSTKKKALLGDNALKRLLRTRHHGKSPESFEYWSLDDPVWYAFAKKRDIVKINMYFAVDLYQPTEYLLPF